MTTLKSDKEIQLAAFNFLRTMERDQTASIEGVFIPADPSFLYQRQQRNLLYFLGMAALCLYIFFYTMITEANYYAQLDPLVIVCLGLWILLILITLWLLRQYIKHGRQLQLVLQNPQSAAYGVILTDEYYFERLPDSYHIISKANIVRIDFEEPRKRGKMYLELLLEMDDHYQVRGLLYSPKEYDIKAWLEQRAPTSPSPLIASS